MYKYKISGFVRLSREGDYNESDSISIQMDVIKIISNKKWNYKNNHKTKLQAKYYNYILSAIKKIEKKETRPKNLIFLLKI